MEEKKLLTFKTKAQRLNITKFPYYEYDDIGRVTYKEHSNSNWSSKEYPKDNVTITKFSSGDWSEIHYDKNGNEIAYCDSDGCWEMGKYDDDNKAIAYSNSDGDYWSKEHMPDTPNPYF